MKYFFLGTITAMAVGCGSENNSSDLFTLPNSYFLDTAEQPSPFGKNIQNMFSKLNVDYQFNSSEFSPRWPLTTFTGNLITRSGTPTIVDVFGSGIAYLHDALDIPVDESEASWDIYAPVSGIATVITDEDENAPSDSYSTSLVIYDQNSHALVSLLHMAPDDRFRIGDFVEVMEGEHIGRVAEYDPAHLHVTTIDFSNLAVFEPSTYFEAYEDNATPEVVEIYFLNSNGDKTNPVVEQKLDIVLDGFDRDGHSVPNFEIPTIGYRLTNERGEEISSILPCNLDYLTGKYLFSDEVSYDLVNFLDLGNAMTQLEYESDIGTDADNPDRRFRYALSNLRNAENSENCLVLDDNDGYIELPSSTTEVKVQVRLMDRHGNVTEAEKVFSVVPKTN